MVKIRLSRQGRRGVAFYRIVVADKESSRDGRNIEVLGHYDPQSKEPVIKFNSQRFEYWTKRGAQCTPTVKNILKRATRELPKEA